VKPTLHSLARQACGALLAALACTVSAAAAAEPASPARASASAPAAPTSDADPMRALPLRRDSEADGLGTQAAVRSFALVLVLGIAAGGLVWNARRGGASGGAIAGWRRALAPTAGGGLRVAASARLSARVSVHVVQWNGREWLLACSDGGVTTLSAPGDAEESA